MLTERFERLTNGSLSVCLAALLALSAGCAAQRDAGWIEELRAREAADRPLAEVGSVDGAFAARVPASAGAVEPGAEADYVALDIGADAPVECALYHDEVEAASTVQTSAASVFAELEEKYGAAPQASIARIDAGAVDASPFLQVYWRYQIARPGGAVFGELKQMIASREGRSIYCVLHDNGYARSFDRVFRELVGSMRFSSYDQLRPYFSQIHVLSRAGSRFGFVVTSVTLEEDGDPRIVRYSAELLADDGGLSARDVTAVERSTVAGMLRSKVFTDFRDGDVVSALALEPLADGGWEISGEHDGETTRVLLESGELWSWIGGTGVLRRVVAGQADGAAASADGAAADAQVRLWEPRVAGERIIERRFSRLDSLPDGLHRVSVYTGDEQTVAVVGADGLVRSETEVEVDPVVLQERVAVDGALR